MESVFIEPTATGMGFISGRAVRIAALFLLFGLLAPPGASSGPAAASGTPSSTGAPVGDNYAVLLGNGRVSEHLSGLPGLTNVGRVALSVVTEPANQPVFVHCSRGKDRAGVVSAIYRMEVDGWSESEAEAEMEAFGFHEVWFQLKKFVRLYRMDRKGIPVENGP